MKSHLTFALMTMVTLTLFTCSARSQNPADKPGDKPGAPKTEETIFAVNVMPVETGAMREYLRVNADVRNASSFDVVPETAGKLTQLRVSLGSTVQADQVIAEVDPSRPGMQFQASQVKTPIGGTVVAVLSSIGATVAPGVPIIRVSRMTETRLVAAISERWVAEMRVGLPATVTLEAFPGRVFDAHVVETAPVLDPVSRTLEIKMQLDKPDLRMKVGMFAMVKLVTSVKENVIRVPSEAVVERFGIPYIFVVNADHVQRRKVTTGLEVDGVYEIVQGLKVGEQIIVRGQTLLEDGSKIRVIETVHPLDDSNGGE